MIARLMDRAFRHYDLFDQNAANAERSQAGHELVLAYPPKIAREGPKLFQECPMSDLSLQQAIDNIYASINNNNEEIDIHIAALKAAMAREGVKEAIFDNAKLAQPNRQGRKMMQSYFKKKGVAVGFTGQ
jgi:hypothetical protein